MNGTAERTNGLILEVARTILINSGLPKQYWGEAVSCACYLLNLRPSEWREWKSGRENLTNQQPTMKYLRCFGAISYAYNSKHKKLDSRAIKCKLTGYEADGYRLVELDSNDNPTGRIIISRDVIFDERNIVERMNPSGPLSLGGATAIQNAPDNRDFDRIDESDLDAPTNPDDVEVNSDDHKLSDNINIETIDANIIEDDEGLHKEGYHELKDTCTDNINTNTVNDEQHDLYTIENKETKTSENIQEHDSSNNPSPTKPKSTALE